MEISANIPVASLTKRLSSFVIDDLVVMGLLIAIFYSQLLEIMSHLPEQITPESIEIFKAEMNQFSVDNLLFIIAVKVIYHTFFIWQNGMTLGKYVTKIKVVEINTMQTPTFTKSFVRALVRIVSEAFFYIGFVFAAFLPLRQTLHDKVAHCVVVDV